jgi:hypothetical protein
MVSTLLSSKYLHVTVSVPDPPAKLLENIAITMMKEQIRNHLILGVTALLNYLAFLISHLSKIKAPI